MSQASVLSMRHVVKLRGRGDDIFRFAVKAFDIAATGEMAVTGPSGSGKSTLLNLVSGLITPDSGTITLAGQEISALGEAQRDRVRGRCVGQVYQTFNLLQGFSALENVLLGQSFSGMAGAAARSRAEELLQRMGLGEKLKRLPSELSVGEQQRVAVARALIHKPQLILADEPTANLDDPNSRKVVEALRELAQEAGAALLLVSHDQRVIEMMPAVTDISSIVSMTRPSGEAVR